MPWNAWCSVFEGLGLLGHFWMHFFEIVCLCSNPIEECRTGRAEGCGMGIRDLGCVVLGLGCRVYGSGQRVQHGFVTQGTSMAPGAGPV